MSLLAAYGLLAHALIFGAIAAWLPLGILRQKAALTATAMSLLVGIAPVMHGVFAPPSVSLLTLAVLQLAGKTPSPLSPRPAMAILAFATVFYTASWGVGPFDLYGTGYQPAPVLLALIPLALFLWVRRMPMGLLVLTLDLAAYATGIFPNLWDVLIDPLLVALCALMTGRQLIRHFNARGSH